MKFADRLDLFGDEVFALSLIHIYNGREPLLPIDYE